MNSPIEEFRTFLQTEKRCSSNTVTAYIRDVQAFDRYLHSTPTDTQDSDLVTASSSDLRSYVMQLSEQEMEPSSINRHISSIKVFYKFLLRQSIISSDPTAKLSSLKQKKSLPHFLTTRQIAPVLTSVCVHNAITEENYHDLLHFAVILTLYSTGLRRSELTSIQLQDLDLLAQTLRITGKGNKQRIIPLTDQLTETIEILLRSQKKLLNICEAPQNFLFLTKNSTPLTPYQIYTIVKSALKRQGINGKCSPHILRHTFATHLLSQDTSIRSIQQLLGHSTLSTTQIYTHTSIEELKKNYTSAHPRAKKPVLP